MSKHSVSKHSSVTDFWSTYYQMVRENEEVTEELITATEAHQHYLTINSSNAMDINTSKSINGQITINNQKIKIAHKNSGNGSNQR